MPVESNLNAEKAPIELPNLAHESAEPKTVPAAMELFKQAVAAREVDRICSTYQLLRRNAKGMKTAELFQLIEEKLQQPAQELLVSVFSHRSCFMCTSGTMSCDTCNGTGQIDQGRKCLSCDGFGLIACGFCRGTGWIDIETMPAEIRPAVLERHYSHAMNDIKRLSEKYAGLGKKKLKHLPPEKRTPLAGWLIRLYSRLNELVRLGATSDEDDKQRLLLIAEKVDECLQALK